MTSKQMRKATLKPGYWFVNVAPLGSDPDWREQPAQPDQDPNDDRIFGYDRQEFMSRQYR